ncbi:MAG: NAD(P)-dependent glycerol-3-phosphate dehydrogenase [Alphaproteobacteria bacterium]|nr:NAD(P)-dependent glycerol-3-phosphate dehydrogenase [Alphaproteobacteria bacterium]
MTGDGFSKIGVIGAGAWGTALALVARRAGREVVILAHEPEVAAAINRDHLNPVFLPGIALDPAIRAVTDPAEAVDADAVLLAMPAQHLRLLARRVATAWRPGTPAIVCAKGIEQDTGQLLSEILADEIPAAPVAILSGPTFAAEVARGLPTAVTLAAVDPKLAEQVSHALGSDFFRAYTTTDIVGPQIGGAVKNVLAIACGIVEGRGMGDNARAALITRGLAEMTRLALAKGSQPLTLMGLSGLGDLTLTCNAMQSRNFSLGVALGKGQRLIDVLSARRSVAEGVFTASSVVALAHRHHIEMPICEAVDAVLGRGEDLDVAIAGLLARPVGAESD